MDFIKKNLVGLIAVIIAVIAVVLVSSQKPSMGAVATTDIDATNLTALTLSRGLGVGSSLQFQVGSTGAITVGSSGSAVTRLNVGTCYIRPYAATIAASSSAKVDCQGTKTWNASGVSALTGVSAGDFVQVKLATSTPGASGIGAGLLVQSASASTTSGFIEMVILNQTGGTYTWPIVLGTASGTASYISSN